MIEPVEDSDGMLRPPSMLLEPSKVNSTIVCLSAESRSKRMVQNRLKLVDWSFARSASVTGLYHIDDVYNIHWYPGRCIPELPSALVSVLSQPGQILLDPFVGSGTISSVALKHGLSVIGLDINPVACLISGVKTSIVRPSELCTFGETFIPVVIDAYKSYTSKKRIPDLFVPNVQENSLWYHPDTLAQLAIINIYINAINEPELKAIALVCFSSILRACSSQQNHWGYICDNMLPKEYIHKDAFKIFIKRLQQYIVVLGRHYECVSAWEAQLNSGANGSGSRIINDTALKLTDYVKDETIDIIMTSPPYPGVNDYVDSQRLTLLWLREGKDLHSISRCRETGARWKRFRKACVDEFVTEMSETIRLLGRSLKRGGYLCLIYGESKSRPSVTHKLVSDMQTCGFDRIAELGRDIPKKRALIPKVMNETIHIFKKV